MNKRTEDYSLFLFKEINFHHLDVQSIAKYLKIKGNIEEEISLSNLCKIYNLKRLKNHDALEDEKVLGGILNTITALPLLLIASGAVVMLKSILKYNGTIRLANGLLSADKKAIHRLEKIHRLLMCFFLGGYLVVLVSLIANLHIVGDIFTGMIFFFGAVFVFIGILLQSNMLLSIRENLEEMVSKNNQLIQT